MYKKSRGMENSVGVTRQEDFDGVNFEMVRKDELARVGMMGSLCSLSEHVSSILARILGKRAT